MNGLTLQHLRYLVALSKHRHFGHAASACAISQPALSIQMKKLEEMVGAPLLERGSRQVNLTPLGAEFVARGQDILAAVDEISDVARLAKDAFYGDLRIGVIPTIAPYLLPALTAQFQSTLPGATLKPREAITSTVVNDLLQHRLDIGIVALPISDPDLQEMPVFDEAFVLVRPSSEIDHPVPPPDVLKTMRLLLLEEGHCFRDQALSFCSLEGTQTNEVMEGSSLSTLVQMVGAGFGLTLIPEMALTLEGRVDNICIQRFEGKEPRRTIGMIWRKSSPMSEQFASWSDIVLNAIDDVLR